MTDWKNIDDFETNAYVDSRPVEVIGVTLWGSGYTGRAYRRSGQGRWYALNGRIMPLRVFPSKYRELELEGEQS